MVPDGIAGRVAGRVMRSGGGDLASDGYEVRISAGGMGCVERRDDRSTTGVIADDTALKQTVVSFRGKLPDRLLADAVFSSETIGFRC